MPARPCFVFVFRGIIGLLLNYTANHTWVWLSKTEIIIPVSALGRTKKRLSAQDQPTISKYVHSPKVSSDQSTIGQIPLQNRSLQFKKLCVSFQTRINVIN